MVTLEEPVLLILSTKINPICVPSLTDTSQTYEGVTATVAGWGLTETGETSTDQLMSVDLPVISNKKCRKFYNWIKRYIYLIFVCVIPSLPPSPGPPSNILHLFQLINKPNITKVKG